MQSQNLVIEPKRAKYKCPNLQQTHQLSNYHKVILLCLACFHTLIIFHMSPKHILSLTLYRKDNPLGANKVNLA